jgi:hypothetical protein
VLSDLTGGLDPVGGPVEYPLVVHQPQRITVPGRSIAHIGIAVERRHICQRPVNGVWAQEAPELRVIVASAVVVEASTHIELTSRKGKRIRHDSGLLYRPPKGVIVVGSRYLAPVVGQQTDAAELVGMVIVALPVAPHGERAIDAGTVDIYRPGSAVLVQLLEQIKAVV